MKRKNGFTLIELLAVIVILAIIAVIATPIIVGIIEDSRKAAFERSVEGIIHATDIDFGTQETLSNNSYTIPNGVVDKTLKTPIKNIDGFNGTIKYDEKGNSEYAIHNKKWCMKKDVNGTTTIIEYIKGGYAMPGTSFTIAYNLNGGTQGSGAVTSYTEETETFNLPIPTKTGSTFKGWYTDSEFTSDVETQVIKGTVENKTYYAKWEENIYTLTVNPNGGIINNSTEVQTYRMKFGETKEIILEENDDYVLLRWLMSGHGSSISGTTFTMGDVDTILIAEIKRPYENGYPVYFDVVNGKKCTNYHEDNSKTGYKGINGTGNQTSCLKFYTFNYIEGETKVNLLLDHNTTTSVHWTNTSTSSNLNGPINVLTQLKSDTASWTGTITPSNYEVAQEGCGNYIIDYSDYKARLITAQEIAQITGNTGFNESTSDNHFYLESLGIRPSSTCTSGDTSGCKYGWLYDRTATTCSIYKCLNAATGTNISKMRGYWTATSAIAYSATNAWAVYLDTLEDIAVDGSYTYFFGVRPVIEVLVSDL